MSGDLLGGETAGTGGREASAILRTQVFFQSRHGVGLTCEEARMANNAVMNLFVALVGVKRRVMADAVRAGAPSENGENPLAPEAPATPEWGDGPQLVPEAANAP